MKKFTKFQKQIIAIVAVLVVAAVCFGVYFISGDDEDKAPTYAYPFTDEELTAIQAVKGATFSFAAEKGGASDAVAHLMKLAEGYASVNSGIKVSYKTGSEDCVLTVDGVKHSAKVKELFSAREDGTPYATTARAFFNKALTGDALGAATDALEGFNIYGDKVNSAGYAYIYDPVERADLKYVYIQNQHDALTFIPLDGSFYLADTDMDVDTATTATMVAAVRAPVATQIIENPEDLAVYGLDSKDNATANILIEDKKGNAHYLLIGKLLSDGTGYYAKYHDKDRVFVMQNSIANYILIPKEDFLVANFGTPLSQLTDVYSTITDISITIGDDVIKASFMSDKEKENHPINYTWKITAPDRFISGDYDYALPNYGNMGDVFNALCALSSDEIVEADVNDETLAKYGLATPFRSYSWVYKGETRCTVHFSEPNAKGVSYVYSVKETVKTGDKLVIGIAEVKETAFTYLGYTTLDYVDTKLFTQYFDKLDNMSFTRGGTEYVMSFTKNSEGTVTEAKLNGKATDLLSCRNFYKTFIHCYILDEYKGEAPKELLKVCASINGKKTEIVFGRISNMKAYCLVNGKTAYTMDYTLLEELIADVDALIAGEIIK